MQARITGAALWLVVLACSAPGHGQTTDAEPRATREHAALAYDRGVSAYDHGDYAAAAQAFLTADALVPNDDALENAIRAARKAQSKPLLEEAGSRGLRRESAAPELGALAREALADAAAMGRAPAANAPASPGVPVVTSEPERSHATTRAPDSKESSRTWSPAVFYAGVGVTAVLTSLTVWSGIDALNAKARLPGTQADNDRVMAKAHRTDAFLVTTLLAAGATAYIGLKLTAFHARTELATSFSNEGATLALSRAW